ncbi:hypothetical protein B381_16073 [Stutzerimonas stutzeri NF13]|uniref:Uncharacterized protein n=1 Tax=Stutzerimonas stutzeri NF13 TaxID=1212548 RepID=M2VGL1_STUST|nr:hypothetical protein [Stutzerimonas stutzeri]EMD99117.1 hypothetical protein B381_16073 [Stutzerimonas stutzeri NF13]
MFIDEPMLNAIKNDPDKGICELTKKINSFLESGTSWAQKEYDVLLEAYALIIELKDAGILKVDHKIPDLRGQFDTDIKMMSQSLDFVYRQCKARVDKNSLERLRSRFRMNFSTEFSYEFSQGDLERLQLLINQIRQQISDAVLEEEHKQRLMARLEKLQSELHKKVSDLDRFWGLIGDAGVVLGKLGEDAKPIVDRVREVASIVWKTQARSEELPSGTDIPVLGSPSE